MNVLTIDVGGTNVKFRDHHHEEVAKFASGHELTPDSMVAQVREQADPWGVDVVSIGYPGPVREGKAAEDPHNLAPGWLGFDFESAFERPTKIINDAAMQALGSYEGGRMLFLGLGTGLGAALIIEKTVAPLEIAHLPYRKGRTYEDYVGLRGLERLGKKTWRKYVDDVVGRLKAAFIVDYVVLGGGNARKLKELPAGAHIGDNANAILGGFRLWESDTRN